MQIGSLVGIGFAVLAALALAVQSLAVRVGTKTQSVSAVTAIMYAVNLVVLLPVAVVVAYPEFTITLRALAAFAVAGLLGSLVGRLCYFIGIERLGSSRTEPLKALFPLVAVGTAVLVLGEQVTATLLTGVVLLVLGGIIVTLDSRDSPTAPKGRALWIALSFPLAAALFLGVDPVFTKIGLAEGTSPLVGVTIRILAAAAGFAAYLGWRAARSGGFESMRVTRWLLVASVANTTYLVAYYAALARIDVAVVTPILGLSTLFVVAGAAAFLQGEERVTWRLVGATAIVVAGVVLVVQG